MRTRQELPAEAAALQAWASVDRDQLIRSAYQAGVTKHRIHTISGIARTTIDRVLARGQGCLASEPVEAYELAGVIERGQE